LHARPARGVRRRVRGPPPDRRAPRARGRLAAGLLPRAPAGQAHDARQSRLDARGQRVRGPLAAAPGLFPLVPGGGRARISRRRHEPREVSPLSALRRPRMKTYAVGGSVRDELLGLAIQDRDYVVVGADPAEMLARGFKAVGADFPVFLHPDTHEEYALARTERKTGPGYKGFAFHAAPDVTLEQDLLRRDLTINAMARGEDGTLVDPHGGKRDLEAGILRHVSEAFAEDPVRILRVARFAARFGFAIAPETE